ncbi:TPA: hypothetical protein ACIZCU_002444 [Legionella pneumophila]|nr:hypothetical protein [Legionella sp. PATHC039]
MKTLYANKSHSIQSICKIVEIGKTTLINISTNEMS